MFILALFCGHALIKVRNGIVRGDLRRATRMIAGEVKRLRGKAACTHKRQVLGFDIDKNYLYTVKSLPKGKRPSELLLEEREAALDIMELPEDVYLEDVALLSRGKNKWGETVVGFFASGCVEPALIHLKNHKDEFYTLQINPVTGHVKVYDRYVDQKK